MCPPPTESPEQAVERDSGPSMSVDTYLHRIGIGPSSVEEPTRSTLERIQRAHVTTVPFENLAIVGAPHGPGDGAGITLEVPHLYEKIVHQERGGYCFELNGLYHWLLAELGYDIDRVTARITSDGGVTLPANHHSNIVHLDERYVVDIGMGTPKLRQPLPLDGGTVTDDIGIEWRVTESDRTDAQYRVSFRRDDEWTRRYVFSDTPRDLSYFEATNDYLQSAPESPFTDGPSISLGTEDGHLSLDAETLTERHEGGETTQPVPADDWPAVLEDRFDVELPPEN